MRVKTFRGTSAAQVMAQIKKELGPEAVILSNQTKRENGASVVEIMAAVEHDLPGQAPGRVPGQASGEQDDPALAGLTQPASATAGWEREWGEIKGHLAALLKPHLDFETLSPRQAMAMRHLEREGVQEHILAGLLRQLRSGREVSLLAELGKLAPARPFSGFSERFQLVAGPSGAGKTSALLRMALAARRANPTLRIGVVNADGRGSGGKTLLKRSAELSGLVYADAPDPEDFTRILMACRSFDVIYVDVPALPLGSTLAAWLEERDMGPRDDVAVHLALPPFLAPAHLRALWERHAHASVKSIIWTKLDEACSFESLINVGQMTGLPASALCFGPGVAGSMVAAEHQAMWKLLFSRQLPRSPRQDAPKAASKAA